jgi:AcrR family transcriptional regulator
MTRTSTDTRRAILDAACQIVHEQGVSHLTLDAAAATAGVSKGGLLYHFPSKDALIQGLIVDTMDSAQNDIDRFVAEEGALGPGGRTRTYLRLAFRGEPHSLETNSGMLAAVSENPGLLEPIRERMSEWQGYLEDDGIDMVLATIVRLAADGLHFEEMFRLAPPSEPLRSRVEDVLRALTLGRITLPADSSGALEVAKRCA